MITIPKYSGKKIGVFGLGKAGEATVTSLLASGAEVYAWDDNEKSVAGCKLRADHDAHNQQLVTRNYKEWPWEDLEALVLSPGVPLTHPKPHDVVTVAREHDCRIIGDIEMLYEACPDARYVAITGTNGKSTTTTLIGHILKSCGIRCEVGGNLGTAALSLAPLDENGVYVLETSSYQLDLIDKARFNVAVWLNITPDHIDRHGDIEGYVRAKLHIFANQQKDDTAVIAVDDEWSKDIALGTRYPVLSKVVPVSVHQQLEKGVYVEKGILKDNACTEYDLSSISTLTGKHNWQNAAASYAACCALGLRPEEICKAMESFAGLRHRLQLVAEWKGIRFINDSKATNADATANALAPYHTIYWIAGGKPKEGGIVALAPFFGRVTHAFLMGEAQDAFAETLKGKVAFTKCGTLQEALKQAAKQALHEKKKGAVVLLSPACASFDQWKNFEERGDAFCQMVINMMNKGSINAA
ncbi:MAG: UDP-N-acetylmuramoyl-L-alanine--D-glutamate ligase [Alphaproteobacteria bacterium]